MKMKQIYAALTAIALTLSFNSISQVNEDFNTSIPSSANCWFSNNIIRTTTNAIEGAGSAMANNGTGELQTPYLNFDGTATITFQYKLSSNLPNGSRTIRVETISKSGLRNQVGSSIILNSSSGSNMAIFSQSVTVSSVERLAIVIEKQGGANIDVLIDNLIIDGATYNYSSPNSCNTAPVAVDDNFFSVYPNEITGNVLINDDNPQTNEQYSVTLLQNVEEGTLNLNADGSFNYIPPVNFSGGPVTFTYRINDNGFDPLNSNEATVTLNYAMQTVLPVKLIHFSGKIMNLRAELTWTLEANETGEMIQVEKSIDGKNFSTIHVIKNSSKSGTETYKTTDIEQLTGTVYYRLKMVNKSGSFSYSKIIILKIASEAKANSLTVLQNPIQSSIALNYTSAEAGDAIISLYNTAGMKLLSFKRVIQKGINTIDQPLPSNVNNGTYFLELIKNNERIVVKLLK